MSSEQINFEWREGKEKHVSYTAMFKIMLVVKESSSKSFIIAVSIS